MVFFKNFFQKKKKKDKEINDNIAETPWIPLEFPPENSKREIKIGNYKLTKVLGKIKQVRPPRTAQFWSGKDENDNPCFLALIEPGEENKKWLLSRLGNVNIINYKTFKVKGDLKKLGSKLSLVIFETTIADRYLIKEEISSSTNHITYEAIDKENDEKVYCTICLPPKNMTLPDTFEPRENIEEILEDSISNRILRVLDEGITKIYGVFTIYKFKYSALYYVITEYIPAKSLEKFLSFYKKKISPENLGYIVYEIGKIFEYLNSKELIHGNITPSSFLVSLENNRIYLNGYSLLSLSQHLNSTARYFLRNIHNNLYLAPEVINSDDLDIKSDYFSLGIILYEFIFGKNPFKSKDEKEILRKISKWNFPDDIKIDEQFEWFLPFLKRLLESDKENRKIEWNTFLNEIKDKYFEWGFEEEEEFIITSTEEKIDTKKEEKEVEKEKTKEEEVKEEVYPEKREKKLGIFASLFKDKSYITKEKEEKIEEKKKEVVKEKKEKKEGEKEEAEESEEVWEELEEIEFEEKLKPTTIKEEEKDKEDELGTKLKESEEKFLQEIIEKEVFNEQVFNEEPFEESSIEETPTLDRNEEKNTDNEVDKIKEEIKNQADIKEKEIEKVKIDNEIEKKDIKEKFSEELEKEENLKEDQKEAKENKEEKERNKEEVEEEVEEENLKEFEWEKEFEIVQDSLFEEIEWEEEEEITSSDSPSNEEDKKDQNNNKFN